MSTSEEILQALQQAESGVGQGVTSAVAAKGKAEQAVVQSTALGVRDKIVEFTALKTAIEELISSVTSGPGEGRSGDSAGARCRRLKRGRRLVGRRPNGRTAERVAATGVTAGAGDG